MVAHNTARLCDALSGSNGIYIRGPEGEKREMEHLERVNSVRRDQGISDFSSASRGAIYEFLSYMHTQNPNKDFIDSLSSDEQFAKLKKLGSIIGGGSSSEELRKSLQKLISALRSLRDKDEKRVVRLQEDYARLFRGIRRGYGPPPPYESVYMSELVMSNLASDVLTLYHKAGLEVRGGEPPDHIGFELSFMAYLCKKEEEYRNAGDLKNATGFTSFQNDFLSDHILTWVPQFCTKVLDYDSAFYAAVAELTLSWLQLEEKNVNDKKSS